MERASWSESCFTEGSWWATKKVDNLGREKDYSLDQEITNAISKLDD